MNTSSGSGEVEKSGSWLQDSTYVSSLKASVPGPTISRPSIVAPRPAGHPTSIQARHQAPESGLGAELIEGGVIAFADQPFVMLAARLLKVVECPGGITHLQVGERKVYVRDSLAIIL